MNNEQIKVIDFLDGSTLAVGEKQASKIIEIIKKYNIKGFKLNFDGMEIATTAFFNLIFDYFLKQCGYKLDDVISASKITNANDFIKFAFNSSYEIAEK